MSTLQNTIKILEELMDNTDLIIDAQLDELTDQILSANHIFLSGAGRSGYGIRLFANRLMHLGLSVSVIGEVTAPHTHANDLLIVGSGSGETENLFVLAEKAKKNGLTLALVTMDPLSSIGKIADTVVQLPGVSPKVKNQTKVITSIQPMGSAFEQICIIVYDALIMSLMEQMKETSETMFERHANLE